MSQYVDTQVKMIAEHYGRDEKDVRRVAAALVGFCKAQDAGISLVARIAGVLQHAREINETMLDPSTHQRRESVREMKASR